jgi:hypothetical protein
MDEGADRSERDGVDSAMVAHEERARLVWVPRRAHRSCRGRARRRCARCEVGEMRASELHTPRRGNASTQSPLAPSQGMRGTQRQGLHLSHAAVSVRRLQEQW